MPVLSRWQSINSGGDSPDALVTRCVPAYPLDVSSSRTGLASPVHPWSAFFVVSNALPSSRPPAAVGTGRPGAGRRPREDVACHFRGSSGAGAFLVRGEGAGRHWPVAGSGRVVVSFT